MNGYYKFKDEYTVTQILWLLKRAITQPVILDFLPENKHRKLEPEKKKNEEMIRLFEQTCMWLENNISIHSVQAFRRKMNEMCEEEDKDKV